MKTFIRLLVVLAIALTVRIVGQYYVWNDVVTNWVDLPSLAPLEANKHPFPPLPAPRP